MEEGEWEGVVGAVSVNETVLVVGQLSSSSTHRGRLQTLEIAQNFTKIDFLYSGVLCTLPASFITHRYFTTHYRLNKCYEER